MDLTRKLAGLTLIGASLGLSALSGFTSDAGLSSMLPGIPHIGLLGFVIAVALVGLGVGVSSEIANHRWTGALVLGVCLIVIAIADRQTNNVSLHSQVIAADQVAADRNAAHSTAVTSLERIRGEIDELSSDLDLMQAEELADIKRAQLYLSSLGLYKGPIDGDRGGLTLAAMRVNGKVLGERLVTLKEAEIAAEATASQGKVVSEAPFSKTQASLYATLITLFSLILSFAGGYLASNQEDDAQALDDLEQTVETFEADILDLADWLDTRAA